MTDALRTDYIALESALDKLAKAIDATTLTLDECKALLQKISDMEDADEDARYENSFRDTYD